MLELVFFFQAEDGIRDRDVTGVQTCALPILSPSDEEMKKQLMERGISDSELIQPEGDMRITGAKMQRLRSEERRVGKECRSRRWPYQYKKKRVAESNAEGALQGPVS